MRRGFDGLSAQVQHVLPKEPLSGHVFVFRGRRGDIIKLLWADGDGLSLFAKRASVRVEIPAHFATGWRILARRLSGQSGIFAKLHSLGKTQSSGIEYAVSACRDRSPKSTISWSGMACCDASVLHGPRAPSTNERSASAMPEST